MDCFFFFFFFSLDKQRSSPRYSGRLGLSFQLRDDIIQLRCFTSNYTSQEKIPGPGQYDGTLAHKGAPVTSIFRSKVPRFANSATVRNV